MDNVLNEWCIFHPTEIYIAEPNKRNAMVSFCYIELKTNFASTKPLDVRKNNNIERINAAFLFFYHFANCTLWALFAKL